MKTPKLIVALAGALLVSACDEADDRAEKRVENAAEASAVAAGAAIAALGLTERQLLDAEIIDPAGIELADVAAVQRDAGGKVDRLLVEIEDSNPDRYVHVPISGLKAIQTGADWNLATSMTRQQLIALPAVPLAPAPASSAPAGT